MGICYSESSSTIIEVDNIADPNFKKNKDIEIIDELPKNKNIKNKYNITSEQPSNGITENYDTNDDDIITPLKITKELSINPLGNIQLSKKISNNKHIITSIRKSSIGIAPEEGEEYQNSPFSPEITKSSSPINPIEESLKMMESTNYLSSTIGQLKLSSKSIEEV